MGVGDRVRAGLAASDQHLVDLRLAGPGEPEPLRDRPAHRGQRRRLRRQGQREDLPWRRELDRQQGEVVAKARPGSRPWPAAPDTAPRARTGSPRRWPGGRPAPRPAAAPAPRRGRRCTGARSTRDRGSPGSPRRRETDSRPAGFPRAPRRRWARPRAAGPAAADGRRSPPGAVEASGSTIAYSRVTIPPFSPSSTKLFIRSSTNSGRRASSAYARRALCRWAIRAAASTPRPTTSPIAIPTLPPRSWIASYQSPPIRVSALPGR